MGEFISLSPLVRQQDPIMSHAISHKSTSENFNFERAFPYLRTLIDMLLLIGGAIVVTPVFCFCLTPNGWKMAVYQAGGLASVFAGATLVISTARTNQLQQRQTAQICIAIVMLFMGGLLIFASQTVPYTECLWYINIMTICVAIWGIVCYGLISIEARIANRLALVNPYNVKLSLLQTLRRCAFLTAGFIFGLYFFFLPGYLIWAIVDPSAFLDRISDRIVETSDRLPTSLEMYAVLVMTFWIMLIKCGCAVHFWKILARFHNPNLESSQALTTASPENWLRYHVLFLAIGVVGLVALIITYNATDFGLESAPWITAAMIFLAAVGCWKLKKNPSLFNV